MRRARFALFLLMFPALLGWKQAHGDGNPSALLHLCSGAVALTLQEDGSEDLTDGSDLRALRDAMDAWNVVPCEHPALVDAGVTDRRDTGQGDGSGRIFLLLWRTRDEWVEAQYDPTALALTTLWYGVESGKIVDGDIEFNDAQAWTTTGGAGRNDVMNTAVHEFGHVLGLDHSQVEAASMFAFSEPGETYKRDPADDDLEGLCTIYSVSYADCDAEDCGCGASGAGRGPAGLWLLALLVVACRSRRRC